MVGADVVKRLHRKAKADRWNVTPERFAKALELSAAHALQTRGGTAAGGRSEAAHDELDRYFESLNLEDLALATACADGNDAAWEHFVREHRPVLYRAADAIDKTGAAREAADALYAELFGLTERDGERRSLFRYFHGRSSLATWLRAVLAQRYVDSVRRTRRLDSLGDVEAQDELPAPDVPSTPDRGRFVELMRRSLSGAIARLESRDRLRLACYHAQGLTLAQIGRSLREHEATVSRHLTRTRRLLREDIERQLKQAGLTAAEVSECVASIVDDAGTLDLAEIFPARKNAYEDRST